MVCRVPVESAHYVITTRVRYKHHVMAISVRYHHYIIAIHVLVRYKHHVTAIFVRYRCSNAELPSTGSLHYRPLTHHISFTNVQVGIIATKVAVRDVIKLYD